MNRPLLLCVNCLLASLFAFPARGAEITFEELPFPSAVFPGQSFETEGFVIENLGSLAAEVSLCSPPCADNGTQVFLTQADGRLRLSHSAGQNFSMESFDAAESFSDRPEFWAQRIELTGEHRDGSTVFVSFSLDQVNDGPGGMVDFQAFVLPATMTHLSALTISGAGNAGRNDFSIDNLQFSSVPEPSSLVLIGVSTLAFHCAWRRAQLS